MRLIKFRVWDKRFNEMRLVSSLDWHLNKVMTVGSQNIGMVPTILGPENYILMQFTGLHDKNGREIWEGDIIIGEDEIPLPIYFNKGGWTIRDGGEEFYLTDYILEYFEVIGNIYENGDLLD